jgi:FdhD protein
MHGSHFGKRHPVGMPSASAEVSCLDHDRRLDQRELPEESPIALVYDGTTAAVLMGTPADLIDLAVGFSITEGIVQNPREIEMLDIVPSYDGIEVRMWLAAGSGQNFKKRQRKLVGPTGCGLCGIESLAEANRHFPRLTREISLHSSQIEAAVTTLSDAQRLNQITRATHAAAFYRPDGTLAAIREDVGRHNALDKLAGALIAEGHSGRSGAIILTSRVSIEMVQKAAAMGCPILVAISAPTALAVRAAEAYGITLVAIARGSSFEIFTHPEGICR